MTKPSVEEKQLEQKTLTLSEHEPDTDEAKGHHAKKQENFANDPPLSNSRLSPQQSPNNLDAVTVEQHFEVYKIVVEWIKVCDAKATVFISTQGLILGFFCSQIDKIIPFLLDIYKKNLWLFGISFLVGCSGFVLLFRSIVLLYRTIFPKLDKESATKDSDAKSSAPTEKNQGVRKALLSAFRGVCCHLKLFCQNTRQAAPMEDRLLSLMYFGDISGREKIDFQHALSSSTKEDLKKNISSQIWINSRICSTKFDSLAKGMTSFYYSTLALLVSFLCFVFSYLCLPEKAEIKKTENIPARTKFVTQTPKLPNSLQKKP